MTRQSVRKSIRFAPMAGVMISLLFASQVLAEGPIEGFRDLKFGMTGEEVKQLDHCSSPKDCMYELSEKNRYITLLYDGEGSPDPARESSPQGAKAGLAKISIDMGHFTDEWYKELQIILGNSYRLTHDLNQETIEAFLAQQQNELTSGYEDGQILLTVLRRPFGNLVLTVIYQNADLAKAFVQSTAASGG
jgi:hypothetical protein